MLKFDKEVIKFIRMYKTINDKQFVADKLADLTVTKGLQSKNPIFKKFYGDDEPDFIIMSCISFGLVNFMEEDFYVVKEVLGFELVRKIINKEDRFIRLVI